MLDSNQNHIPDGRAYWAVALPSGKAGSEDRYESGTDRENGSVRGAPVSLMTQTGETTNTHLALLHRISSIVSSDQDIESILHEMVMLTMNVTHSDACLVYLIDHATNEIVLRASQLPHDAEIGNVRMKMGEGITGWVAAHNSVVALPRNASADARFKPFSSLQEDTYQAFLSVPLVDSGEIIGVINVHHREPHQHSSDEVALVTFIGEQMGGVIARARLAEQSQTRCAAWRRWRRWRRRSRRKLSGTDSAGDFGDAGGDARFRGLLDSAGGRREERTDRQRGALLGARLHAPHADPHGRLADRIRDSPGASDHHSEHSQREAVPLSGTGAQVGADVAARRAAHFAGQGDRVDQHLHARRAHFQRR